MAKEKRKEKEKEKEKEGGGFLSSFLSLEQRGA